MFRPPSNSNTADLPRRVRVSTVSIVPWLAEMVRSAALSVIKVVALAVTDPAVRLCSPSTDVAACPAWILASLNSKSTVPPTVPDKSNSTSTTEWFDVKSDELVA